MDRDLTETASPTDTLANVNPRDRQRKTPQHRITHAGAARIEVAIAADDGGASNAKTRGASIAVRAHAAVA